MKHFIKYIIPNTPCNSISKEIGQALIGAGGSVVSGILGAFGLNDQTKKAFEYNQKLMEQQQGYNVTNMNLQRDINKELARYGYDLENEYNSPSAQRKKMEAAGLNPYYNEQGSVSAASNPNMQQVSQPSVSIPNFQAQSPWAAFANLPTDFAQIANAFKAVQEAKKAGADAHVVEATANDVVKQEHYKTIVKEFEALQATFDKNFIDVYGAEINAVKFSKMCNEVKAIIAQGRLDDALAKIHEFENEKNEKLRPYLDKMAKFVVDKQEAEVNLIQEQGKTEQSKQNLNNTSADTNRKVGNAQIAMMNAQARLYNAVAESNEFDNWQKNELKDVIAKDIELQQMISDSLDLDYLTFAAKWDTYIRKFPVINTLVETLGGIAGTYTTLRGQNLINSTIQRGQDMNQNTQIRGQNNQYQMHRERMEAGSRRRSGRRRR